MYVSEIQEGKKVVHLPSAKEGIVSEEGWEWDERGDARVWVDFFDGERLDVLVLATELEGNRSHKRAKVEDRVIELSSGKKGKADYEDYRRLLVRFDDGVKGWVEYSDLRVIGLEEEDLKAYREEANNGYEVAKEAINSLNRILPFRYRARGRVENDVHTVVVVEDSGISGRTLAQHAVTNFTPDELMKSLMGSFLYRIQSESKNEGRRQVKKEFRDLLDISYHA